MKIRLLSDLHLEFALIDIPVLEDEKNIVCVLAGDIGIADMFHHFTSFIRNMCERHRTVIYIPGNHEHYHGSIQRTIPKIKEAISASVTSLVTGTGDTLVIPERYPSNLYVVNKEVIIIDNTAFVCATMWTDYNHGNPIAMYDAQSYINDFRQIRSGTVTEPYKYKLTPQYILQLHHTQKKFVFDKVTECKEQGFKTVVVTHHAMSERSIADQHREGFSIRLNPCYASDCDNEILAAKPDLMVHGHTHNSFDYIIEDGNSSGVRVVCNPRGYFPQEANPSFNPSLILEV